MLKISKYVIFAILTCFSLIILAFYIGMRSENILLVFYRTGGILGLKEKLIIYGNGKVLYSREKENLAIEKAISLKDISKLEKLKNSVSSYCGIYFETIDSAADYFTYILEADNCKIMWVDEWASKKPIPKEITELQLFLQAIISKINSDS